MFLQPLDTDSGPSTQYQTFMLERTSSIGTPDDVVDVDIEHPKDSDL